MLNAIAYFEKISIRFVVANLMKCFRLAIFFFRSHKHQKNKDIIRRAIKKKIRFATNKQHNFIAISFPFIIIFGSFERERDCFVVVVV